MTFYQYGYREMITDDYFMKDNINTGRHGEEIAGKILLSKHYRILQRNWRAGHKEIDIIAMDGETLVFVEVKTRMRMGEERYNELVRHDKQRSLLLAGNMYMVKNEYKGPFRFDVLFIIGEGENRSIEHIRNAFDSWG